MRFGAPASDAQPETVTRQRGGGGGSAVARRTATPRWCRNAAPHDEAYERTSASAVRPRRARARSYGVTGRVTDPAFPAEGASGGLGERGKHRAHGSKRTAPGGSASAARRRRRRLATAPLSRRRQATPRRGAPRGPSRVERLAARRRRDTLGVGATLASVRPSSGDRRSRRCRMARNLALASGSGAGTPAPRTAAGRDGRARPSGRVPRVGSSGGRRATVASSPRTERTRGVRTPPASAGDARLRLRDRRRERALAREGPRGGRPLRGVGRGEGRDGVPTAVARHGSHRVSARGRQSRCVGP